MDHQELPLLAKTSGEMAIPAGFCFSAVKAGIKASGNIDLALAEMPGSGSVAAVFTKNLVVAAPIQVGRKYLKASGGKMRAVVVNAGNANCATGKAGVKACQIVCQAAAKLLGSRAKHIFPSSTGIIGVPFPAEKVVAALPALIAFRKADADSVLGFARGIMTTDSKPKLAWVRVEIENQTVSVLGVAKGAGMIHPHLATMLAYVFSDIDASAKELHALLQAASDDSFNCISIDGDTSTNDTVLLMASGAAGVKLSATGVRESFSLALRAVCGSLAEQIVADGEGVTHVVNLKIEEARNRAEAAQIARAVAHSPLVKTAWAGADPNWGRILAAIGRSGIKLDPARVDIYFGAQKVCSEGAAYPFDPSAAHQYLQQPRYEIRIVLRRGRSTLRFVTCDLTSEYVHINADYTT